MNIYIDKYLDELGMREKGNRRRNIEYIKQGIS